MQRIVARGTFVLIVGLAFGLVACGTQGTMDRASNASASAQSVSPTVNTPARVMRTLARIDAGTWPPQDGSGTHGGARFGNFERRLPAQGLGGKPIAYTEWDINIKKKGADRDAERIVTGSDGSAWFTLDHYQTFTRIR